MKKIVLFILFTSVALFSFPRKSIIERYTNASCAPCASVNNAWYTATVGDLVNQGIASHLVVNVNWPGANDPMYLLNSQDNAIRWGYYGVASVPWVNVNGTKVNISSLDSTVTAVQNGNQEFSPFKLTVVPEKFSNNVFSVKVTIHRDATDPATSYSKTMLRVALAEKTVSYTSPPGTNGEKVFYWIARKFLPGSKGTLVNVPAPGDSVVFNMQYLPGAQWLATVNPDSLSAVVFIQNDSSKYIYQSISADLKNSARINAAFTVDQDLTAPNSPVTFSDFSIGTGGGAITSWKWDFNNDGVVDATTQNPTHTYTQKGKYSVGLTVSDGTNQVKRVIDNMIEVISNTANILVVNGIDFYYGAEVTNFYAANACFGDNDVDMWDVFGDQGVNYAANPRIKQINLYNKKVPSSLLKLYKKVIWIGNNYTGDLAYFDQQQVVDYVTNGGSFLLATRQGSLFLNGVLSSYAGITGFSGDVTFTQITSADPNLLTMPAVGTQSLNHYVVVDTFSYITPLFDDNSSTDFWAGIRVNKPGHGNFIFIAGRPYRYDLAVSATNYNYIIANYMNSPVVSVKDNESLPLDYSIEQNYPNPFNPATTIGYTLPVESNVKISVFNTLGELVAVPVNAVQQGGRYTFNMNAAGLTSGVYVYTIHSASLDGTKSFSSSKKMVVLK